MKKLSGYTLVEIMVALVIISYVLVNGLDIVQQYLHEHRMEMVYEDLKEALSDLRFRAVSGFIASEHGQGVRRTFLYVPKPSDAPGFWLVQVLTGDDPEILFQEFYSYGSAPLSFDQLSLSASDKTQEGEAILMEWLPPFLRLRFSALDMPLVHEDERLVSVPPLVAPCGDCQFDLQMSFPNSDLKRRLSLTSRGDFSMSRIVDL